MDKKKIKNIILNLDLYIAGLSFAVIVLVTFCGVLMRYVFHNPFVWEEEVQVELFLWVVFFGGIACFRKKMHVSITSLYDHFSRKGKLGDSLVVAVVVVATLLYLLVQSSAMVAMFIRTDKTTSVLSVPCAFIYGILPLCCLLMIVQYLAVSIPEIVSLAHPQVATADTEEAKWV